LARFVQHCCRPELSGQGEETLAKLKDNPAIGHRHNQINRKNTFVIAAGDYHFVFELLDGSARVLRIVHGESDIQRLEL